MTDASKPDAKTLVARLRERAFGPSSQHQVGDFTIATADMTLKDEDCAKAADAIEELTAMLRLVTIDGGGPRFEGLAHATAARALLTKYGASNG